MKQISMKRMVALLLAALLSLSACALAEEETENWYLATARELTARVGELARDEAYQRMLSSTEFEAIDGLQAADFTAVRSAWRFTLYPTDFLLAFLGFSTDGKLSEAGREAMNAFMPQSVVSQKNAQLGATTLAAATILSFSCSYPMPEDFEPCVIALEVDGAAAGVTFAQTGAETITATACPLFHGAEESDAQAAENLGGELARTKEQLL